MFPLRGGQAPPILSNISLTGCLTGVHESLTEITDVGSIRGGGWWEFPAPKPTQLPHPMAGGEKNPYDIHEVDQGRFHFP